MIVKHPRMIIKQHEYFINYRYVGDVSLRASSKNRSYLRIKTTMVFCQVCCFNLQQGPAAVKFDSTKVGETDNRKPPLCKTSCMSVGGTSLMCMDM